MSDERLTGTVKWFNDSNGYGFITPNRGGKDIFVHYSAIQTEGHRSLTEGEQVEFSLQPGPKGAAAINVVCISLAPSKP